METTTEKYKIDEEEEESDMGRDNTLALNTEWAEWWWWDTVNVSACLDDLWEFYWLELWLESAVVVTALHDNRLFTLRTPHRGCPQH